MLAILAVNFPFFALIFCGWLATRRGLLPLAAIPGLNGFVLFFALPCMLYRFGARTPIHQLLDLRVAAVYLASAVTMVALAVAVSRRGAAGFGGGRPDDPDDGDRHGADHLALRVLLVLAKLLLHPVLVLCAGAVAAALGAPVEPLALTALVLVAALPSASNVSMLAERFGAHNGRIARVILVSTVLAFLSFSAAVALVALCAVPVKRLSVRPRQIIPKIR